MRLMLLKINQKCLKYILKILHSLGLQQKRLIVLEDQVVDAFLVSKKEMKSTFMLKFCNVFDNVVLSAQFNGEKFYFIPRYLNYTNWKKDFHYFEKFLSDFKPNTFCIVGDLGFMGCRTRKVTCLIALTWFYPY